MSSEIESDKTMTPAVRSPQRPTSQAVDPLARQLGAALVVTLLLVFPLRAVLATTTYMALYGWVFGSMAAAIGLAFVLRWAGIPGARSTIMAAVGSYAVFVIVALWAVAGTGDPGDHGVVALTAGLPSAALATVAAVFVVQRGREFAAGAAICIGVVGTVTAVVLAPRIGELLVDARDAAADQAEFEAVGLEPYVPQIDGMDPEYTGTKYHEAETGTLTGYKVRYRPEGTTAQEWNSAALEVRVSSTNTTCEPTTDYIVCRPGAGYVIQERQGQVDIVMAERTGLTATYREGTGELPDPDVVGAALAEAEPTEWDELFALRD